MGAIVGEVQPSVSGRPTLASVWVAAAGAPVDDELLGWPPDVFALPELILDHAEAYRFALSPRTTPYSEPGGLGTRERLSS